MKLSVIVPCYNVEAHVERTLDSILGQGVKDMEVLLINDGSVDATPEICDRLAAQNPQVKVFHQENGGLSAARNTGIDHARGDYIAFVDSDDVLVPGIYPSILQKMEDTQAEVGVFNLTRVYRDRSQVQASTNQLLTTSNDLLEVFFNLKGANFYAWNKVMKASLLNHLRFEKGVMYEDIMFSYKLSLFTRRAIVVDQVGIYYMDNDQSIVNQSFNPNQYDNVVEREKLYAAVQHFNGSDHLNHLALDKLVDGFLSTAFKITGSTGPIASQYYQRLLRDLSFYQPAIRTDKGIDSKKKWALRLLAFNPRLYYRMYKLYLNK